jgi:hypothetical protein
MSDPTSSGSGASEDLDLSAAAIAVLEFTTDRDRPSSGSHEPYYITSKDAFPWAGLAFSIAEAASGRLEDIEVLASLYEAVRRTHPDLTYSYQHLPSLVYKPQTSTELVEFSLSSPRPPVSYISRVMSDFVKDLVDRKQISLERLNAGSANKAIEDGYKELVAKGLIIDPIFLGGLEVPLAILGLIPFSVTRKTAKGQTTYLRVKAGLWSYQRNRTKGGPIEVQFKWEVARIAKNLKRALVAAFDEITKDGGDEPPDQPAVAT